MLRNDVQNVTGIR